MFRRPIIGTGSGKLGAVVALLLGAGGMVVGGMAFARYRRMTQGPGT
ncbi:DUF6223 family protein [Chitinophaga sp. XS-30]